MATFCKSLHPGTIRGVKLKLGIHAEDIGLYIDCDIFYSGRIRILVAMATYIFHGRIMGKVKIYIFFCLNGYIWNLFLQKCLLCSPLSFVWFLSKSPNLIGCQGDKNGKF